MQAGNLRHRVLLQSLTETRDPTTGAVAQSWVDFATVWGDVRYLAGVTEKMRAVHDGKNFDINAVLPDMTGRRWLDLACTVGANNG